MISNKVLILKLESYNITKDLLQTLHEKCSFSKVAIQQVMLCIIVGYQELIEDDEYFENYC